MGFSTVLILPHNKEVHVRKGDALGLDHLFSFFCAFTWSEPGLPGIALKVRALQ